MGAIFRFDIAYRLHRPEIKVAEHDFPISWVGKSPCHCQCSLWWWVDGHNLPIMPPSHHHRHVMEISLYALSNHAGLLFMMNWL